MYAPVSVVIACYRCSETIERAVDSVYQQTSRPFEVILVDDFSEDGTLGKLSELKERYPEGWIKIIALKKNSGPGTARNEGWSAASQEYIAFLDSDDSWHPRKIEVQVGWMMSNPKYSMTGHSCRTIKFLDSEGASFDFDSANFRRVGKSPLLSKNYFSTQTVMLRRDLPFRFRAGKRYCEDYLLACEICMAGYLCAYSSLPLANLYKDAYGAGGLSGNLWRMWVGELEVYRFLFSSRKINFSENAFFMFFSFLRFSRRCMVVLFRGKS